MVSQIDPTKPTYSKALTSDVRDNFAQTKTEIEQLQSDIAGLITSGDNSDAILANEIQALQNRVDQLQSDLDQAISDSNAADAALLDKIGATSSTNKRLHVGGDKRLYGPDGKRVIITAITSFADSFALFSDGYRLDWGIRNSQYSIPASGISPPINRGVGVGKWLSFTYRDDATCKQTIKNYNQYGFNTIRTWIGIGMLKTAPFTDTITDPITGLPVTLNFPVEIELLDNMVRFTSELGMYIWLTFGQGSVPDDQLAAFWTVIAGRYKNADNVILDIQNEPGSGIVYVDPNNPTTSSPYDQLMPNLAAWRARFEPCLAAMRGAGFQGPIVVQCYSNLWGIDTIQAALNNPPWINDSNIIVAPHMYYIWGNTPTTFASQRNNWDAHVTAFSRHYCIVHGEMGPSNAFNYVDPQPALTFITEALGWTLKECFSGTTFFTAQPLANHYNDVWDNTTEFTVPGNLTAWGTVLMNYRTKGVDGLVKMVPNITTTGGPLTDTTGTVIKVRRQIQKYDMQIKIVILTNGPIGTGTLLAALPSHAPSDEYQLANNAQRTVGGVTTIIRARVIGKYVEFTNLDGSYPGGDGVTITANLTYYAADNNQGLGFKYTPEPFRADHRYLRGGLVTGLNDGKKGTIITTLDMTGGDGIQQRIFGTNASKFTILRTASNFLELQLRNAAGTIIGLARSTVQTNVAAVKHTIFCGWDLNTPEIWLYIKGVNYTDVASKIAINDIVDYTDTNLSVGGLVGGGELLQADMDFFVFEDDFYHPGNYIYNGILFDMFDDPIDFGKYCMSLFGHVPKICMRILDPSSNFGTNFGSGGTFTRT